MKRGLVDLSSVIWTCLMAGKDREFGREVVTEEGKKVWVNSADYGYDNALNHLKTVMDDLRIPPRHLIFVIEGIDSKLGRQMVLPEYKSSRKDVPELYDVFNAVKSRLLKFFLALGAQAVTQPNVEADDIIGYLAKNLQGERWIISADKDLAQCVGGDVHQYRMGVTDENPFGPFPHHLIPVCIALVGDSSDKIPGARGFGPKAFLDLLSVFGEEGLESLRELIETRTLDRLTEDVGELKALHKVIDDADNVYKSYECGRLWIDKVNSVRRPLEWQVGMVRPRSEIGETQFNQYGGLVFSVTKENLDEALSFFGKHVNYSPEIALDIETSTPPESDEWIENLGKKEERTPVDVFGSTLTGMSLTFGWNMQYTIYISVDHLEEDKFTNVSKEDVVRFLRMIPKGKEIVVHNAAFELPVCYMELSKLLGDDPEWHGFLPNVIDSRIMSSYVDENRSAGLKSLSKEILGYEQETYQEVTTHAMSESEYADRCKVAGRKIGKVLQRAEEEGVPTLLQVQFKMNELTCRHVLSYGADDTICTAALSNHFRVLMELEGVWDVFMQVEQLPAYVTAKAFVDGVDFSLETMGKMEKEDDVAYDAAWKILREYLIKIGFDGVHPPVFTEITLAAVKEAHEIITGVELKTLVRTPSKLAKLIKELADGQDYEQKAYLLATFIESGDLNSFNELVCSNFDGEPKLDLSSPKQMAHLLYDRMGLPVNIVNDTTPTEKTKQPELADAVRKFKTKRAGKDVTLNEDELALVRKKAKSDDTAIEYALAFDAEFIDEEARAALKAIGVMKRVITRRNLFYKTYWVIPHWKDGKIHSQINQCGTVTRRYSASNPNANQLPKAGDGVRFRRCFKPHHRNALVGSADYTGQELRLSAEVSQDKNLLSCYVGENLKDVHSITAAGAMKLKWGVAAVKQLFEQYGYGLESNPDGLYELFVRLRKLGKSDPIGKKAEDLRKTAKVVNFGSIYGAQAPKLAETLIMPVEDAQLFLEARNAMFPGLNKASDRAEEYCKRTGYSLTLMGARRHLRNQIMSDDRWESARAARQAFNFQIQGSAAEMTKLGISRLWKTGALFRLDMRFWFPVHDELVFSAHKDHMVEAMKIIHDCMVGPYSTMRVPILSSLSLGPNYGEQEECGDWFIEENVREAISRSLELEVA